MNRVDEEKVLDVTPPEREMTVARVWRDWNGSALTQDVAIGATTLYVENSVDFEEDGGTALIDDEVVTYSAIDDDLETITCTALTAAHSRGAFVYDGENQRGPRRADGYIDGEYVQGVFIPRFLWSHFPLGKREPEEMEVVPVKFDEDGVPVIIDGIPDDPDEDTSVSSPAVITWSMTGDIEVSTRPHQFPLPFGCSIEEVRMTLGDGDTADDTVTADILIDGVSILTTKPTIASGSEVSAAVEPTTKEHTKGDLVQIQFETAGSYTQPGANPTLYLTVWPTEDAAVGRIEVPGLQGDTGEPGLISTVQDEGVAVTDAPILDFTGAGVTVTSDGTKITANIPGGGGGSTRVAAKARISADTSITPQTWTAVPMPGEDYDSHAFHSTTVNTSRLTVPTGQDGLYSVKAGLLWASTVTYPVFLAIRKNGNDWLAQASSGSLSGAARLACSSDVDLVAGDYVEVWAYHNTVGSARDVLVAEAGTWLALHKVA